MISLEALSTLFQNHSTALKTPIAQLEFDGKLFSQPALMATVNLSRDSTYRESIAISTEAAIRKSRVYFAQGADLIDIGAESSTAKAARVNAQDQIVSHGCGSYVWTTDGVKLLDMACGKRLVVVMVEGLRDATVSVQLLDMACG